MLARLHPRAVGADGVDLAVMSKQAKRLRQPPGRMRVRGVTLMENDKSALEVWILQVEIKLAQVRSCTKSLINNRLCR